jgi:hypothetical protein
MLCIFAKNFKMKKINFLLLLFLTSLFACKTDNNNVLIGEDEWMTENLSV